VSAPQRLSPKQYEKELLRLQTELVYMQEWIVAQRRRLVVLFEGRDHARQVLAVGLRRGAGAPFREAAGRPTKALEVQPHRPAGPRPLVDYAEAKDRMFARTDTDHSPWHVVEADDKRTARLNLISHLLSLVPYEHPDKAKKVKLPARQRRKYKRPPKQFEREVPVRYTVS